VSEPASPPRPGPSARAAVRTRLWRDGRLTATPFALGDLDTHLADPAALAWVDLVAPGRDRIAELATELNISGQSVEDILAHLERPKAMRHGDRVVLTMYATSLDDEPAGDRADRTDRADRAERTERADRAERTERAEHQSRLRLAKISAIVLPRALITIRPDDAFPIEEVLARWDDNADLLVRSGPAGVGALTHGLIDAVVDSHFETIQRIDDAIEDIEDVLFQDPAPTREVQQAIYRMRKELVQLRRVVLPMRELVNGVLRHREPRPGDAAAVAGEATLRPWYDDLYDHVLRAAEWTESLRDMVSSVFETNLSLQDARLNSVMKKLAAWAAIIAVPTAVTGWFGQNVPYPGFQDTAGLWQSVVLVVVGAVGLYVAFRRRDWL